MSVLNTTFLCLEYKKTISSQVHMFIDYHEIERQGLKTAKTITEEEFTSFRNNFSICMSSHSFDKLLLTWTVGHNQNNPEQEGPGPGGEEGTGERKMAPPQTMHSLSHQEGQAD